MAVLLAVAFTADVDPVGATVGGLFDNVVEGGAVDEPEHPLVEDFKVGMVGAI